MTRRPLVIAHRGASGEWPENTRSAYEQAIAEHADMIEIDLHLSRDGVIMIHHDASLERMGEAGEIRDHTAAELASLDVAPDSSLVERMPTLVEVLEEFGERIAFNLEIKTGRHAAYEGIEALAVAAVEGRGLMPKMLFSSFHDPVLARLRAIRETARLAVLVSPRAPLRILKRAAAIRAEAIHPEVRLVKPALVRRAHAAGLAVYPYTEDDPIAMTRLLDAGVDGIITNHPARLHRLLAERSP